jgi:predicted dehydrogenase
MISRRTFLTTTVAASMPLIISADALGRTGPGANATVHVGLIGLGGRCKDMVRSCVGVSGMRIVAVCDCDESRMNGFIAEMYKELEADQQWAAYTDLRRMIDKENLDAVMVETTTHARAWVTCYAMACGLDAYIEKPMSLTIAEGRQMVDVARKHKCVTQIGTQQRSIPLNNWASDLVQNGALGRVHTALAPNFMGPLHWEPKPGESVDNPAWWSIWSNQAAVRPYHRDIHHRWNWWWDYDGGGQSFGVTGWGTHSYDQMQRGLGTSETGPVELALEEPVEFMPVGKFEPRHIADSETGAPYYDMIRTSSGPRGKVRMKYANGVEVKLHLDGDLGPGLGCIFQGENGTIEINRDKISADPIDLIEGADRPAPLQVLETRPHIENWLDCIRTRQKCTADIEYGHRSTTVCYLVNIVRDLGRVGEPIRWDPVAERFTNSDEGNAMLTRTKRETFEIPRRFLKRRIKNKDLTA